MLGLMTVAAHREAMAAMQADLREGQKEARRIGAALNHALRERDEARAQLAPFVARNRGAGGKFVGKGAV